MGHDRIRKLYLLWLIREEDPSEHELQGAFQFGSVQDGFDKFADGLSAEAIHFFSDPDDLWGLTCGDLLRHGRPRGTFMKLQL
jgi:hypothetical protein